MSTHSLKEKLVGNITPMDHMLRVLNGEHYSRIHVQSFMADQTSHDEEVFFVLGI